MARKKNKEDQGEPTVSPTIDAVAETPADCPSPLTDKYEEVVKAAKAMIHLYETSHTVESIDDYRYAGLKALVLAVRQLNK